MKLYFKPCGSIAIQKRTEQRIDRRTLENKQQCTQLYVILRYTAQCAHTHVRVKT